MEIFYVLGESSARRGGPADTEFGEAQPWHQGEAAVCTSCGKYTSLLPWLAPYRAELECWGRDFGDFAFDGAEGFLVSERFKDLYDQTDFTGLRGFCPVEVTRVKRHRRFRAEPPRYYYVEVIRSHAAIDEVRSEFEGYDESEGIPLSVCLTCRRPSVIYPKRWKRYVLQAHTWGGEDIFIPRGCSEYLTTERFKRFCERNGVSNAVFIPAEEYWKDFYPWENIQKGCDLMRRELDETLLEKRLPDGTILRYQPATNYMVAAAADGAILWVDRPFGGIEYWNQK